MSGVVLAISLALPTTLLAAQPASAPNGSGTPAPAGPEQPSPPPSSTPPPAPPTDQLARDAQPPVDGPVRDVAGPEGPGSGGGDPARHSTLASGSAAAKSGSVSIVGDTFSSFAYRPKSITVQTGDRVRWNNKSGAPEGHNVTGDGLDSGTFFDGESYSHTFSKAGKYSYICTLHPAMKGSVTVRGSGGGGGGSQSSGGGGSPSGSGSASGGNAGSGFAGGSSGADPGGSGSLPATGLPLIGLGVAGLGLVLAGLLLRRWTELGWYY